MKLPQVRIEQQFSKLGMQTTWGRHQMSSPRGNLEISHKPAQMEVVTHDALLEIDSANAWLALGKGSHEQWLQLVYGQMKQQFMINLSKIVDEGNQLANFKGGNNAIADIARQRFNEESSIQYTGEASSNNVHVNYTPAQVQISWTLGETNIQYTPRKPEISYTPNKIDIYLQQKNYIKIDVNNIDQFI
ncbi:DUF6470 family protein [Paenibacillus popilliae]|nr:DUF6470 family protein [Paenibacillus sp. SDF0028]